MTCCQPLAEFSRIGGSLPRRANPRLGSNLPDSHNPESIGSAFVPGIHNRCAYFVRQYLTNLGLGFGNLERQRRKRPAFFEKSGLVRPPIRETLTSRILHGKRRTVAIGVTKLDPVIVAEIKLGKVTVQVLLGAMLIVAFHAALED